MTTEQSHSTERLPNDEMLAAGDQLARERARSNRALNRGRLRRRVLPGIIAASAVVVTLGAADRFVQGAIPSRAAAAAGTPGSSAGSASTLAQISKALAADQRAIAALAQAQVRLATTSGDGAPAGGSSLPSLGSVAALPSFSTSAAIPAPTVSATTGASVVIP